MRIGLLLIAVSLMTLCGCIIQTNDEIRKAEWLIGTWENKTSKGIVYENWIKVSSDEILGKSYIVKGKDTTVFETIRIVQERSGLFYIPVVKDQNEGLPVRFNLKYISDLSFIFENLKHDFPQIISYTKINTDSLVAEISGTKNGKDDKRSFPMKRMN